MSERLPGDFFMKILVVEDNKNISEVLKQVLEIDSHECIVASSGRNGLSMIQQQKFDAVFLDLAMPEFSGMDVIDSLEKSGEIKEQKIIVFTASAINDKVENDLIKKGIYLFLRKPIGFDEIRDVLKNIQT